MSVKFHFQKRVALKNRKLLKEFIPSIFSNENHTLESLDVVFCDDEYILGINRAFLKHDYYTDIITFDMSNQMSAKVCGEIYISIDTVASNSLEYGSKDELYRVIFHGALHLCGYRDKQRLQKIEMRTREDFYLAAFHKHLSKSEDSKK